MTIAEDFNLETPYDWCWEADEFLAGTEYEIENIEKVVFPGYKEGWEFHEKDPRWFGDIGIMLDLSLRNNGLEFVTKPLTFNESLNAFKTLHDGLVLGPEPYSARTSTHVHVNVMSMSKDQLKHMVLLYAVLEPLFFKFVGDKRKHNIHCVPLNHTLLPNHYHRSIDYLTLPETWSKYTAFNLLPVRNIGTVEFRHLYGTGDIKVYQQWLTMLKELWEFAYKQDPDALSNMLHAGWSAHRIQMHVIPSAHFLVPEDVEYERSLIDVKLAFV